MTKRAIMKIKCFLILFLLLSCKKNNEHWECFMQNSSSSAIYFYYDFENYPYTAVIHAMLPYQYKVEANQKVLIPIARRTTWEEVFDYSPSGTIMFFIFDEYTVENLLWDSIVSQYLVLKRFDYSIDDLKMNNWTIIYP